MPIRLLKVMFNSPRTGAITVPIFITKSLPLFMSPYLYYLVPIFIFFVHRANLPAAERVFQPLLNEYSFSMIGRPRLTLLS
jgi:hypothetical protein